MQLDVGILSSEKAIEQQVMYVLSQEGFYKKTKYVLSDLLIKYQDTHVSFSFTKDNAVKVGERVYRDNTPYEEHGILLGV